MKLLIMGPPGVGKGTQAKQIKASLGISHISTGDILRSEMKNNSEIGLIAKDFINNGKLVPDKILISMIRERIIKPDCKNGYILDGFPRTLPQANGLNDILEDIKKPLDIAISLYANKDELINRLVKRGKESGRSDDKRSVIEERQKVYWDKTAPLIDFYKNLGLLREIDGLGKISDVTEKILKVIC